MRNPSKDQLNNYEKIIRAEDIKSDLIFLESNVND